MSDFTRNAPLVAQSRQLLIAQPKPAKRGVSMVRICLTFFFELLCRESHHYKFRASASN
jgi:hypothetical protein